MTSSVRSRALVREVPGGELLIGLWRWRGRPESRRSRRRRNHLDVASADRSQGQSPESRWGRPNHRRDRPLVAASLLTVAMAPSADVQ